MLLNKLTCRSLITDKDVDYNFRLGIPVEVFCTHSESTIAFGQIERYSHHIICVAGSCFDRQDFIFIGQRQLEQVTS
ncbi:hypothetical protein [Alteribacillus sp. YIM 98480]|uniref:hypothetical protein n=1 Tax=Alteribacillus sp. YIM 98480 TaxID=2606599 RepID=UPI00131AF2DF|nr:hypothetical protein [Alteribacillus sp. YIM 98480]